MELYKFRPLANETDFERAKRILETGEFWCSNFSELNDPMEGIILTQMGKEKIDEFYNRKVEYKICSFSGTIEKPLLWGYYANGFKGMAIKISIEDDSIREVEYNPLQEINCISDEIIKKVLTTKLKIWENEAEYRCLVKKDSNCNRIGGIKEIYFGNPYGTTINKKEIYGHNKTLQCYECRRNKLIRIACAEKIKSYFVEMNNVGKIESFAVKIEGNKIIKGDK